MAVNKKQQTPEQQAHLRRHGLDPAQWEVLQDYPHSMLVRHRETKEARVLHKNRIIPDA